MGAEQTIHRILEDYPDDTESKAVLVYVLGQLGKHKVAQELLSEIQKTDGDKCVTQAAAGFFQWRMRNFDEAREILDAARKLAQNSQQDYMFSFSLALLDANLPRIRDSITDYEASNAESLKNNLALRHLLDRQFLLMHFVSLDFRIAINLANEYVQLAPDSPAPYIIRGDIYRMMSEVDPAWQEYVKAATLLDKKVSDAYSNLLTALAKGEKSPKPSYEQAQQLDDRELDFFSIDELQRLDSLILLDIGYLCSMKGKWESMFDYYSIGMVVHESLLGKVVLNNSLQPEFSGIPSYEVGWWRELKRRPEFGVAPLDEITYRNRMWRRKCKFYVRREQPPSEANFNPKTSIVSPQQSQHDLSQYVGDAPFIMGRMPYCMFLGLVPIQMSFIEIESRSHLQSNEEKKRHSHRVLDEFIMGYIETVKTTMKGIPTLEDLNKVTGFSKSEWSKHLNKATFLMSLHEELEKRQKSKKYAKIKKTKDLYQEACIYVTDLLTKKANNAEIAHRVRYNDDVRYRRADDNDADTEQ